jgi:hypothetical protein
VRSIAHGSEYGYLDAKGCVGFACGFYLVEWAEMKRVARVRREVRGGWIFALYSPVAGIIESTCQSCTPDDAAWWPTLERSR